MKPDAPARSASRGTRWPPARACRRGSRSRDAHRSARQSSVTATDSAPSSRPPSPPCSSPSARSSASGDRAVAYFDANRALRRYRPCPRPCSPLRSSPARRSDVPEADRARLPVGFQVDAAGVDFAEVIEEVLRRDQVAAGCAGERRAQGRIGTASRQTALSSACRSRAWIAPLILWL